MRVLVPLDESALAELAIPEAVRLVKAEGGEILLLTVGEPAEASERGSEEHRALLRLVQAAAGRISAVPVGVRTDQFHDAARDRTLPVETWYPADACHQGEDLSPDTRDNYEVLPGMLAWV